MEKYEPQRLHFDLIVEFILFSLFKLCQNFIGSQAFHVTKLVATSLKHIFIQFSLAFMIIIVLYCIACYSYVCR